MFNIGDIISGNARNTYGVTNRGGTYEVIKVFASGRIKVKVLSHRTQTWEIGNSYEVDSKFFKLIKCAVKYECQMPEFSMFD